MDQRILPPTPRAITNLPTLNTLKNCLAVEKRTKENTLHVARPVLKPGTKILYKQSGKEIVAIVISVDGIPGKVRLFAEKITTARKVELRLEDVIGIVVE